MKQQPQVFLHKYDFLPALRTSSWFQSPIIDNIPPLHYIDGWNIRIDTAALPKIILAIKDFLASLPNLETIYQQSYKKSEDPDQSVFQGAVVVNNDNIFTTIGYQVRGDDAEFSLASNNEENLQAVMLKIKEKFNELLLVKRDIVPLHNYFHVSGGASSAFTKITCPSWKEIKLNYALDSRKRIDKSIKTLNGRGGQLLIWYGETGTGKTFAIRSLMRKWKEEYEFANITDSDKFLEFPDYYYSAIQDHSKPIIFIMEDAADNLLEETRKLHGGRISRLLNLTDGLLAQGRKDLFVVTFNEKIKQLDRAVVRSGRCQSWVRFDKLNQVEAREWATDKGLNPGLIFDKESWSLADLYALKNEESVDSEKNNTGLWDTPPKSIGFNEQKEKKCQNS